ncbi:uncharacterized protein LOC141692976 [Apium graveolens]|uniref:uncharacterized protein LOC141692976 n=1 Tax=Apium graveolens TaxID=4045 RepID=UPI003D79E89E
MMKLSDKYGTVRGNVLMMKPLPTIAQTYRLFAQEEQHKELSSVTQNQAMAFYADKYRTNLGSRNYGLNKSNNSSGIGRQQIYKTEADTSKFGYKANSRTDTSGFKRNQKPAYFCTNCQIPGHSIERCFRIHGFPPGFQNRQERKVAALSHNQIEEPDSDLSDNAGPFAGQTSYSSW